MMNVRRGIALLLVLLLTGCTAESAPDQPGGRFAPGQYQGTGQGYGGPITVEVEVSADPHRGGEHPLPQREPGRLRGGI